MVSKCKILVQRAHRFKAIPIRFLNHTADRRVSGRNRGIPLPDIYPLCTHPFLCKIIRAICPSLNINSNDFFSIFFHGFIVQKHRYIGLDGISYHIADLQRYAVRIGHSDYRTVILNVNIQFSTSQLAKAMISFLISSTTTSFSSMVSLSRKSIPPFSPLSLMVL